MPPLERVRSFDSLSFGKFLGPICGIATFCYLSLLLLLLLLLCVADGGSVRRVVIRTELTDHRALPPQPYVYFESLAQVHSQMRLVRAALGGALASVRRVDPS